MKLTDIDPILVVPAIPLVAAALLLVIRRMIEISTGCSIMVCERFDAIDVQALDRFRGERR